MKAVLSLSGGLDSSTLLAYLLREGNEVLAVNFGYGSKHQLAEQLAAKRVSKHYNVPILEIDLRKAFTHQTQASALLQGGPIPEGHYQQENMKQTVVPGRNTVFAAVLLSIAEALGYTKVALAVHQGDHYIYPDCRPQWVNAISQVAEASTEDRVHVVAPFLFMNKAQIVALGTSLGVPYELTHTCYKGSVPPCGKCGACVERAEAFSLNNLVDPLEKKR